MFFLQFNGKTNLDFGIDIVKRPDIPPAVERIEEIKVKGRPGTLYKKYGYESRQFAIDFNFYCIDDIKAKLKEISVWINNVTDNKLKFSDDREFFYFVENAYISSSSSIELNSFVKFTVTFIVNPYMYSEQGQRKTTLPSILYNMYEEARPIYEITGEGNLTLTVNGVATTVNVGQAITINTDKGLCYKADGTPNNIAMSGAFKNLYLKEGNNIFSYTSGFTVNIIPNWRRI